MNHIRAVAVMIAATFLWSIAGAVTRHLDAAQGFEVTFWRSFFAAVSLGAVFAIAPLRRAARLPCLRSVRHTPGLWISSVCWAIMFVAFMVALTLTSTAKVLIVLALGPLFTAIAARVFLGQRLPLRTVAAIVVAGAAMGWMFSGDLFSAGDWRGTGVALCVPLAAAVNWTVLQRGRAHAAPVDLMPAVLIGAVLSALLMLPLARPFATSLHDLGWLAILGSVQLALPCAMAMAAARVLPAPELALLALLEVIFGIVLAWAAAGEQPALRVLTGGAVVVAALVANELLALRYGRMKPSLPRTSRGADPAPPGRRT